MRETPEPIAYSLAGPEKGAPRVLSADDLAAAAHDAWLAEKRRRGVTSWPNETGQRRDSGPARPQER